MRVRVIIICFSPGLFTNILNCQVYNFFCVASLEVRLNFRMFFLYILHLLRWCSDDLPERIYYVVNLAHLMLQASGNSNPMRYGSEFQDNIFDVWFHFSCIHIFPRKQCPFSDYFRWWENFILDIHSISVDFEK